MEELCLVNILVSTIADSLITTDITLTRNLNMGTVNRLIDFEAAIQRLFGWRPPYQIGHDPGGGTTSFYIGAAQDQRRL